MQAGQAGGVIGRGFFGPEPREANGKAAADAQICPAPADEIRVARGRTIARPLGMGSKYLPTRQDQQAAERFAQKQNNRPDFKKLAGGKMEKNRKKK